MKKIKTYKEPVFGYDSSGKLAYSEIKKSFTRDGGPLKEGRFCEFIGCLPEYVGFVKPKPYPINYEFWNHLYNNIHVLTPEEKASFMTMRKAYSGGYASSKMILEIFAGDSEVKYKSDEYLEALNRNHGMHLSLPQMKGFDVEDLESIRINLESSSGYFTGKFCGRIKRYS